MRIIENIINTFTEKKGSYDKLIVNAKRTELKKLLNENLANINRLVDALITSIEFMHRIRHLNVSSCIQECHRIRECIRKLDAFNLHIDIKPARKIVYIQTNLDDTKRIDLIIKNLRRFQCIINGNERLLSEDYRKSTSELGIKNKYDQLVVLFQFITQNYRYIESKFQLDSNMVPVE